MVGRCDFPNADFGLIQGIHLLFRWQNSWGGVISLCAICRGGVLGVTSRQLHIAFQAANLPVLFRQVRGWLGSGVARELAC